MRINGTFTVSLSPLDPHVNEHQPVSFQRKAISKQFSGQLEASSEGEMLSAITGVQGSAGYVAIEKVSGTLQGRKGSFVMLHKGLMNRSAQSLQVTILPDSGTEELTGIAGTMTISIENNTHFYELDFSLPEKKGWV